MKYLKDWRYWAIVVPMCVLAVIAFDNFVILVIAGFVISMAARYTLDNIKE